MWADTTAKGVDEARRKQERDEKTRIYKELTRAQKRKVATRKEGKIREDQIIREYRTVIEQSYGNLFRCQPKDGRVDGESMYRLMREFGLERTDLKGI